MRIAVCGIGHSGIVTAIGLCEFGHIVSCFDINPNLSESIENIGSIEPGVSEAVQRYVASRKLQFTITLSLDEIDAVFITIPIKENSAEDVNLLHILQFFEKVTPDLHHNKYMPFFVKTTFPVGLSSSLANSISQMRPDLETGTHYEIIYNPNFMREGSAIHDFMSPDRMIFGLTQTSLQKQNSLARKAIDTIFYSLKCMNIPFLYTNYETAEMIKSATMGFVTIKMAYANEVEKLCSNTGVDLKILLSGIGSDRRISREALEFSTGVGGSSLPRSARLLIETGKKFGSELPILATALASNEQRIIRISEKILQHLKSDPSNCAKKVSILGITFKPFSDDITESASMNVIRTLLHNKINVSIYDPYYLPKSFNIKNVPNDIISNKGFSICCSAYDCVYQSNVLVTMTNWPQFRQLDMLKIRELMQTTSSDVPTIFDCSNVLAKYPTKFQYIAA